MSPSSITSLAPVGGQGKESLLSVHTDAESAIRPDPADPHSNSGASRAEKLADATRQFEAYILRMLLKEMRKSENKNGLFKDKSMEGYRDLLDDALAKRAAEAGSFGLAKQMLKQLETMR